MDWVFSVVQNKSKEDRIKQDQRSLDEIKSFLVDFRVENDDPGLPNGLISWPPFKLKFSAHVTDSLR